MRAPLRLPVALIVAAFALCAFTTSAFAAAPSNDNFASAVVLEDGINVAIESPLTDATREVDEPIVLGADTDHTVWFRWKATQNGTLRASTCEAEGDGTAGLSVAIYTGSTVSGLSSADAGTENCGPVSDNARAQTSVTAGQSYFIQVGMPTATVNAGAYLALDFATGPPANDNFADAQTLGSTLPQTATTNNSLATTEVGEFEVEPDSNTQSVWFKWTADENALVALDTCASPNRLWNPDSRISVFTEGITPALGDLDQLASNDDGCGNNNYMSYSAFSATAGTTYWLRLTNYSLQYGSTYNLRLRKVGGLANIALPRIQDNGAFSLPVTLAGETGRWDSLESISYTYAWERCDLNGENCETVAGASSNSLALGAGDVDHTFRIVVTASDADENQTVRSAVSRPLSESPANDNIASATDLVSAFPTSVNDDNYLAGTETDELGPSGYYANQTVWYRWTAPSTENVYVDLCDNTGRPDNDPNFTLGVFTGDDTIAGSTRVSATTYGCGVPGRPRLTLAATAGTTYRIQVGSLSAMGSFRLSIRKVPVAAVPIAAPADPLPAFTLKKLGTVKPKKGKVNLKKLSVTCGATATGNCAGSLTIKSAKKKVNGKTVKSVSQTFKVKVAPGKKLGTSYKLNKKLLNALKSAKKLKATVTVKLGAPGFSQKTASTGVTFKT